ncbi:MAG: oligosaccharide flippase family protein, partial [Acidimicrobiales bacterium]
MRQGTPVVHAPGAALPVQEVPSGGGGLREIAIRSGTYLAGREAGGMVVRLAGLVLVVRAIGPAAYGTYSAAAVFAGFAVSLSQLGAEVFLVKADGPLSTRRYDEVFTVLLITSSAVVVVGLGLSYALAPWLRPVGVLTPLRVMLLTVPVNVLWAPAQACLERRFAFRQMGLLELGGDFVLYGFAVPLALSGFGQWSLVAGYVAWQSWLLVGSILLAGLRPRLAWSRETARA